MSPVVRRRRPARRPRLRSAGELLGVLAAPVALFYILRPEPYFLQNALDPQIYIGFAAEPDELFERFGNTTYYAVRFGLLWPMEASTKLFGVTGGYFVMRWALAVLGGGCMYWAVRRLATRPVAAAAALFFITSPVTLRALMTAYSDTTSLMYLGAAASLLLTVRVVRHRVAVLLAVGLLLGLAMHSNPFNVLISCVVVGSWVAVELRTRRQHILADLGIIAAAVVMLTLLGMLVYQLRFGAWNLFTPSLSAFQSVSGDSGNVFRSPTLQWTKYQLQLYVPLLVLAAFAAVNCRSIRAVSAWEATSALMLAGVFGVLTIDQFLRDGTSLETFYYSSCLAPFVALVLAATLHSLWRTAKFDEWKCWVMASLIVAVPFAVDLAVPDLEIDRFPTVLVLILVCTALAFITAQLGATDGRPPRGLAVAAALAAVSLIVASSTMLNAPPQGEPEGTLFNPHYENALGNPDRLGLDIYRLSFDMVAAVPPLVSEDGVVLVWNNPQVDPFAGTLTGTFVGFSSTLQGSSAGMPEVSPWLLSRLPYENVDMLVLIDKDPERIREGTAALRDGGVEIVDSRQKVLSSGDVRYFLEILDIAS